MTAVIPLVDLASAGSVGISVSNPSPGGGTSAASLAFTVTNAAPSLTTINPASVIAGSGSFNLTVNGAAFVQGALVLWNGSSLTTSFSTGQTLIASVPGTLVASGGTASISVRNLDGQLSGTLPITIVPSVPAPTLTSVTPLSTPAGSPNFTLTIVGTGFTSNTTVLWNSSPLVITSNTPTQLIATVTSALVQQPGSATLSITTPAPGGGTVVATFTITQPAPTTSGLSPSSIAAGSTQFTLTVTGQNFVLGSTIQFNNVQLVTTFVSPTQLTATVGANLVTTQGSAQVVVINPPPAGGSSAPLAFTILPAIIHTFQPGLQLIGVPGDFSQVTLTQALDIASPLLAAWAPAINAYALTPASPSDVFHPGQGYWVRFTQAAHLFDLGQPVSGGAFFSIPLQSGWNMITCPYSSPVEIAGMSVMDSNGVVSTFGDASTQGLIGSPLYSYTPTTPTTPGAYVGHTTDTIDPYLGYWVLATSNCTLRIPAPTFGIHAIHL